MKPYKIAVCVSGQPRSWSAALDSFKHYYSSNLHEFYFFGHAWDENSWKKKHDGAFSVEREKLSISRLRNELATSFNLNSLKVDHQLKSPHMWAAPFKSVMHANHLKTQHEINSNFLFDIVVKTRWDACYDPSTKFEQYIPDVIDPMTLYAVRSNSFGQEYRMPNIDDIMYFGSSRTMNIIDSLYHYYVNGKFFEMTGTSDNNPAMKHVGMGVMLHRWASLKNLFVDTPKYFSTPPIIRQSVAALKWPEDYHVIKQTYLDFYS